MGGHIYEGDIYDGTNNDPQTVYEVGNGTPYSFQTHPNELLNDGRAAPRGQLPQRETTRHFISDLDAMILADAYGYSVTLPSAINTAHASLDWQTGTLLVQGGVNSQGNGINDTIDIRELGPNIQVQVFTGGNVATELFPRSAVSKIV